MKYMCLLYTPDHRTNDDAERDASDDIAEHVKLAREAVARRAYVTCGALALPDSATTVRIRDGELVLSDGPFAETAEVLGGYYVFDCADLDEAIELAAKLPAARDGSVEVRPMVAIPGWEDAIGLGSGVHARTKSER